MTDRDEIELPPLPPFGIAPIADEQTVRDYARAAVIADRKRRAEQTKPAKPKVHSEWIELFPDGSWTIGPDGASYHSTSTMLHICWTDDGRAWIDNERNRELAKRMRYYSASDEDGLAVKDFEAVADALDGGVR